MKTYKVWFTLFDDANQMSSSGNCEIDTIVQAMDGNQAQKMIEAQYNGRAKVRSVTEQR